MEELRIVLLGKQGAGKSSAGNTLLGKQPFHTAPSSQSVTKYCSTSTSTVDGHRIRVVDTPGWTDFGLMEDETIQQFAEWIDQSDPGPHVFLLVLPIGRFTKEEINTAQQIYDVFGKEAHKYTMVLFTRGDDLDKKTIKEELKDTHPDLKNIIEVCGGRYHVFNNKDKCQKQVSELLKKIKTMVNGNKGRHYTKAMCQKTVEQMEGKWKTERFIKAVREEVKEEMNNSAVGSNGETRSKNTELKPSPDTKETVSTPSAEGSKDNSNEFDEMKSQMEKMIDNMKQVWFEEKSELKREIEKLQCDVSKIMSVLEQQGDAFNKLKAEKEKTGSISSRV